MHTQWKVRINNALARALSQVSQVMTCVHTNTMNNEKSILMLVSKYDEISISESRNSY